MGNLLRTLHELVHICGEIIISDTVGCEERLDQEGKRRNE